MHGWVSDSSRLIPLVLIPSPSYICLVCRSGLESFVSTWTDISLRLNGSYRLDRDAVSCIYSYNPPDGHKWTHLSRTTRAIHPCTWQPSGWLFTDNGPR